MKVLHVIKLHSVQMYNAKISDMIAEKWNNGRYRTKCSSMLNLWVLASTNMYYVVLWMTYIDIRDTCLRNITFEYIRLLSESV